LYILPIRRLRAGERRMATKTTTPKIDFQPNWKKENNVLKKKK